MAEAAAGDGPQLGSDADPDLADRDEPDIRQRLRADEPRTNVRSIRYNDAELGEVEAAAHRSGLTLASFVGKAALAVALADSHTQALVTDDHAKFEALDNAARELSRVGNNLNQIAKIVNSGGIALDIQEALRDCGAAIAEVRRATNDFVGR
ncbi:hypothetical protein BIV57_07975 [Mangrovactinospora gilvigrisea]|uniref:Bacterial mobilisation domain-containing protein n=1 Tax=Mangrovactinospora gilvigrisea TaxID=1428644 RepID=A0A1J7C8Z8_9ACTN|nr:MobC family plasmid mobilization relaxosome protein [Mangrovactinospora gilvigrisea]OIV38004.1 hypothetical protein BIV57_07975 [Mangrovactinospora gilvigrisea]